MIKLIKQTKSLTKSLGIIVYLNWIYVTAIKGIRNGICIRIDLFSHEYNFFIGF